MQAPMWRCRPLRHGTSNESSSFRMNHLTALLDRLTRRVSTNGTTVQPEVIHNENSVQTLIGHPIGERVLARQAELEAAMEQLDEGTAEYVGIDTALATLAQHLQVDLNNLDSAAAHALNHWLERNKYLGLTNAAKAQHAL